ncbi:hypothetical protein PRUB_a2526 [Pseudoalteromonas rubra]|uniref:Steroid 5-alpha reductase C-terminal domain-containing protein n=1 Tax=Pseudoalteromonas rubra TaxID=43658 RepID=A0A8T0CB45_9GAMM|nr:DUF1295 domain-containing protein [Pseudoalteromonas rubra]KAF7787982.1 hypothetical protein PRUB_a2524 [Pseudoalteromonas rubra]KAF7787984.1 hypothetical protein PRUB_a2526 [Pseudoalteromonas rubra]
METINQNSDSQSAGGGVNREHGRTIAQRWTFVGLHFGLVLFCAWLAVADGWTLIGQVFGQQWTLVDNDRALLMLACVFVYWLRHAITVLYLLQRRIDWGEALGLLCFMAFFEIGLLLVGGGAFRSEVIPFGTLDIVALVLLAVGSYLNSGSEIQRKWWKQNPANKGQCYTEGLFKHSMHINYFGDVVLFTGWCLLSYNYWTLLLPFFMAYSFISFHIPALDGYLSERYGEKFDQYAAKTKKLIPFVY